MIHINNLKHWSEARNPLLNNFGLQKKPNSTKINKYCQQKLK